MRSMDVLQDQIKRPRRASRRSLAFQLQKRLNFEMSSKCFMRRYRIASALRRFRTPERTVEFLEDELSVVTGAYQDLLTLDDCLKTI